LVESLKAHITMVLVYLLFLLGLAIIILDTQAAPVDKKIRAWKTGRIKLILGSWTILIVSSVAIMIHIWHILF
jgi:hypothetical protein